MNDSNVIWTHRTLIKLYIYRSTKSKINQIYHLVIDRLDIHVGLSRSPNLTFNGRKVSCWEEHQKFIKCRLAKGFEPFVSHAGLITCLHQVGFQDLLRISFDDRSQQSLCDDFNLKFISVQRYIATLGCAKSELC